MLLAGGQGNRPPHQPRGKTRGPLWRKVSHHRLSLSNCINSGIDTVGVLAQYRPLELNAYIGNGRPWDLDRSYGGVHIPAPYMREERAPGTRHGQRHLPEHQLPGDL